MKSTKPTMTITVRPLIGFKAGLAIMWMSLRANWRRTSVTFMLGDKE